MLPFMKPQCELFQARMLRAAVLTLALLLIASTVATQADPPANHSEPIPIDQLGVVEPGNIFRPRH